MSWCVPWCRRHRGLVILPGLRGEDGGSGALRDVPRSYVQQGAELGCQPWESSPGRGTSHVSWHGQPRPLCLQVGSWGPRIQVPTPGLSLADMTQWEGTQPAHRSELGDLRTCSPSRVSAALVGERGRGGRGSGVGDSLCRAVPGGHREARGPFLRPASGTEGSTLGLTRHQP